MHDPPVRKKLEPAADTVRGVSHLRVARFLKQRERFGVYKAWINEIGMPECARGRVPLALRVTAKDRMTLVIGRRFLGIILDPDVIEALWSGLERDLDDGALRVEE